VTITNLEKQKRAKGRYNIFVDGEFFCGLYEDTILKFDVHVNESVDEKELEKIREFDEFVYGKNAAYHYLSYRIRTISEIRKKLKEKKISEGSIQKVLELLETQKLTNDSEFARALIADQLKKKPVGKKILRQKLFEKGVPKKISDEVLENELTEEYEKELAGESFRKYLPKLRGRQYMEKKRKAFDFMARSGFDFEIINEILNRELKND
jgi:regulatory protein